MRPTLSALAPFALAAPVLAQSAAMDMTGMLIRHNTNQSRNSSTNPFPAGSPQTIAAAAGYSYNIDAMGKGTSGLMASLFPNPTPLGQILDYFNPGQSRLLRAYVRNDPGTIPCTIYAQTFSGTLGGLGNITFRLTARIDAAGVGYVEFSNVSFPLSGLIVGQGVITSGSTTLSRWTPTAPVQTEWHFAGNLDPVADSGPAKMRYLDDPAFGPPLRGSVPDPTLPTGVTQAQSSFGTTSSFGIAPIGGQVATVYKTSPTRNLSDPTNPDKCRPIGLAIWPNTRDFFPDDKIGQWTIIYDILIPSSSWSALYPVALLQDTDSNSDDADMFIQHDQSLGAGIGYGVPPAQYVRSTLIVPDAWLRIALSSDGYSTGQGRLFVNGTFIGTTGGDWLYNSTNHNDPRFGDQTAVPPATWSAWGQFPSPWALSQGSTGTPMQSTFSIFSDDTGDGESVYIKNLYFTDHQLTDAQIAALGGASAAGIVFTGPTPCYANCDGSTTAPALNVLDFSCFLNRFAAGDSYANCDHSTTPPVLNVLDFSCFLNKFAAGCS